MDKNYTERSFFVSEITKEKFGLNALTCSKVITYLIFTKFIRYLMEVRHLVHCSRCETCKKWYIHIYSGAEAFLWSRKLCSPSRTSQHFMEPEGSIPCSQEPCTDPYPEPHQSNPHHPILFLSQNDTISLNIFTLIICTYIAKLHLHSRHRSREINNVSKLWLLDLQAVYCRSAYTLGKGYKVG
jgi:hypothetical protein